MPASDVVGRGLFKEMTVKVSAKGRGGTSYTNNGEGAFWAQEAGWTEGRERPVRTEEPKGAQRGQSVFEQGREWLA